MCGGKRVLVLTQLLIKRGALRTFRWLRSKRQPISKKILAKTSHYESLA